MAQGPPKKQSSKRGKGKGKTSKPLGPKTGKFYRENDCSNHPRF